MKLTSILLSTNIVAAATAKSLQSCLTLCNPIDGSPPGSPVHGILQARTLEWGAIPFSTNIVRSMYYDNLVYHIVLEYPFSLFAIVIEPLISNTVYDYMELKLYF